MPNGTYGGVRGRKMKVGGKLLHFPPTRLWHIKLYYVNFSYVYLSGRFFELIQMFIGDETILVVFTELFLIQLEKLSYTLTFSHGFHVKAISLHHGTVVVLVSLA